MATGQNLFTWNDRMVELLIVKVKSYPIIYDYTLKNFKDPEIRHNAFQEIALQMGDNVDPKEVESVWFKTRKKFQDARAADRRAKRSGAALDDGDTTCKWPLMKSMMWMEKYLKTRKRLPRVTNMPREQQGEPGEQGQASNSSGEKTVNQPASGIPRKFLSTSNNLEDIFSDESVQMTDDNPPRFVVCEKKAEQDSQETQYIDPLDETEELQSQQIAEYSKEEDETSKETDELPATANKTFNMESRPGCSTELPGLAGKRTLNMDSRPGCSKRTFNESNTSASSLDDSFPYYSSKQDLMEPVLKKNSKSGHHDSLVPILSKLDNVTNKFLQAKLAPAPQPSKPNWAENFGIDIGLRLTQLPKRKGLELRREIERLIFDAEFDVLLSESGEGNKEN